MGGEEVQTQMQGLLQGGEGIHLHTGNRGELGQIIRPGFLFQIHGLIRTPGGQHRDGEGLVRVQLLMILQGVHGIIGGADGVHIAHENEATAAEALAVELFPGQVPDLLGGVLIQDALIAEEAAELQMAPVVDGVADGLAQHLGKLQELIMVGGLLAGDVFLRHAGGAHEAPLVMIAAQPDLGNVVITDVFPDFLRVQMAVVVDDGAGFGRFVIEHAGGFRVQEEVLIQKGFHGGVILSYP